MRWLIQQNDYNQISPRHCVSVKREISDPITNIENEKAESKGNGNITTKLVNKEMATTKDLKHIQPSSHYV